MRKCLLTIGKLLIILSMLWPIPLWYALYPVRYQIKMPELYSDDYWWILLGVMALGIIMCVAAHYTPDNFDNSDEKFSHSLSAYLFKVALWCLTIIGGFALVVLLIVGLYYTFCTEWIDVIVPAIFGIIFLVGLIWFGWTYYQEHKSDGK